MRFPHAALLIVSLAGCSGPGTPQPAPEAAVDPPPAEAGALVVAIGEEVLVSWPGATPESVAGLPLDAVMLRGSLVTSLFDRAKARADELKQAHGDGGPAFTGRANLHVAPDSPVVRSDFAKILYTLGQAQFANFAIHLGDDGPLASALPIPEPTPLEAVEPHVGSVFLGFHRDVSTTWVGAVASWSEAPGSLASRAGLRPDLPAPLAGAEGCHLVAPGPPRDLSPHVDSLLRAFGIAPTASLTLGASPHTALTDELRFALDLQAKGWTILQAGAVDTTVPAQCDAVVRTAEQLSALRAAFEDQPAGPPAPKGRVEPGGSATTPE